MLLFLLFLLHNLSHCSTQNVYIQYTTVSKMTQIFNFHKVFVFSSPQFIAKSLFAMKMTLIPPKPFPLHGQETPQSLILFRTCVQSSRGRGTSMPGWIKKPWKRRVNAATSTLSIDLIYLSIKAFGTYEMLVIIPQYKNIWLKNLKSLMKQTSLKPILQ